MEEKVLQGKKNGMLVLLLTIALFLAAGIGLVFRDWILYERLNRPYLHRMACAWLDSAFGT